MEHADALQAQKRYVTEAYVCTQECVLESANVP